MTGDFGALVQLLEVRIDEYYAAHNERDRVQYNRYGSGPDLTPQDEAVLQAQAGVINAANNLVRLA